MIRALLLSLLLAVAAAAAARAEVRVVTVTSPGGIGAWLYEDHGIPILTIDASFLGGAALDAPGHEGTTTLMAALLDEGAGELDSRAFATAREDLAAQIGFFAGDDDVQIAATMLSETRDATVELLRLALTRPRFDPEPVARVRGQLGAQLRQNALDPQARAAEALYAQAFPEHPYGRRTAGTEASLAAMTVKDIRAAHAAALTRAHLRVAVVGDITPEALGPMLDRLFGGLPAAGPDLPPVAAPRLSGGTTVIDFDAPQSLVLFGDAGIMADDPDYPAAMVMNEILGGASFGSRLGVEIREKRGLSYGVNTFLAGGQFGALYLGAFSSSNARVAEALAILRAEWARMAGDGVTEAELARAKRYLTGEFPLRFAGNANIAASLLGLQLAGRGPDYVNRRNGLVEAVAAADVARVARRLLRPETLTTVVVGRPEGLAADN